ncbi:bis(5'-nucleosyl)-tetraphosphatase [Spiribacter pallidus]|jgi:8-oxo-dGTP pyrophosphatase MutT (NUDIX family)|uniref:bis(5'-nucleosyl)-tetraphosphatase n=1 Tax=Spiribacter pallidus TaxID=1987936 RepID=UPI0034A04A73
MPEGRARILSAGVVVVRPENATWQFLLLRAYQYWDFPKGRTEPDETPKQAALREVAEETGITDLTFPWGDDYVETGPYARGKIARYYLGETQQKTVVLGIAPELGTPEHHEWRWVDFATAYAITAPRVRHVLDWAVERLPARPED